MQNIASSIAAPIERLTHEGPLIYSMFLVIIALLIAALIGLYLFMRQERNFWRNTSKELYRDVVELLNHDDGVE